MQRTIKITDESYQKLKLLKKDTEHSFVWIIGKALENYCKAKKILTKE